VGRLSFAGFCGWLFYILVFTFVIRFYWCWLGSLGAVGPIDATLGGVAFLLSKQLLFCGRKSPSKHILGPPLARAISAHNLGFRSVGRHSLAGICGREEYLLGFTIVIRISWCWLRSLRAVGPIEATLGGGA